jgi:curved DNA-binding protein CbpA
MTKKLLNYYDILEITPSATEEEIKKAYREKVKTHHPDKDGGSKSADEMFKLLTTAKECLLNPEERLEHDYCHGVKERPKEAVEEEKSEWGVPVYMVILLVVAALALSLAFTWRK